MDIKKSYIPLKVLISYLVLASLIVSVGWFLYSENRVFLSTENKIITENSKIIKVSSLLSNMYKAESLARITIQSNSKKDYENYTVKADSLRVEIDSLKLYVTTPYQIKLLDSVNYFLTQKTINIKQLKEIKSKDNNNASIKTAINDLTNMEASLRKLEMRDFVQNPSILPERQRNVLKEYVAYLNQNIPDDSTNTLTKKASDSLIQASKTLLREVRKEAEIRNNATNFEENKILANGLSISEKLREILNVIEREIILNTTNNTLEKENSLKKTNQIVSIAAIIGLVLTVFFSILILNDFLKTESYKKQLELANSKAKILLKNREQLISTVSHDLKTPLSTIVGYTELMGNSALNDKQLYFTKNIKSSAKYISQLIQDLLDFTQIEAGKITIEKISFSLNEILNEVAKSVQSVYEQKPIELIVKIDEKLNKQILGDPFRLRQILTNLIGNAYKFTAEGFIKITADVTLETSQITIYIEDSGIGIEPKKQQLIFEEFTQADEKIVKKYGGTGLGLTISKKMVEILGGTLSLKSQFGKGSIFEIKIPLEFDKNSPKKELLLNNSKKELSAIVIDDDTNLLELTTEVLKQNNYKVFSFSKASDALKAINTTPFDFIITDIQMPEMDGFQFIEELKKKTTAYKNQAVIALTGRLDLDKKVYEVAGFTEVIKKPYSPKELLTVIAGIFNSSEVHGEINEQKGKAETNETYSLETLKSFLSDKEGALREVLVTFRETTIENLQFLEVAISENNIQKFQETSHRMSPMFKQIQAHEISDILDKLEREALSLAEIQLKFKTLKNKISALFLLLEKESL